MAEPVICHVIWRKCSALTVDYLYKYGSLNQYSEALFSTPEIFFSAPSNLNDPFECRPHFTFEGTDEQIIETLARVIRKNDRLMTEENARAHAASILIEGRHRRPETWDYLRKDVLRLLGNKIGMYCMSEKPNNILMWAHYANHHYGYCLQFEATDHTPVFCTAQRVEYPQECPVVDFFNTPNDKQVDLIFLTKFGDWRYESEWRIIDHDNGPGLKAYPTELLKGVIFGMRIREEDKALIKEWVARRGSSVRFYNATQNEHQYSVTVEVASC